MRVGSLDGNLAEDNSTMIGASAKGLFLVKLNELEARVQKELQVVQDQEDFITALRGKLARTKGSWANDLLQSTTACLDSLAAYESARRARLSRQHGFTKMLEQVYAQKVALHKKIQPLLNEANRMNRPVSPPREFPSTNASLNAGFNQKVAPLVTALPPLEPFQQTQLQQTQFQQTRHPAPLMEGKFQLTPERSKPDLRLVEHNLETKRRSYEYGKGSADTHNMMVLAADVEPPRPPERARHVDSAASHRESMGMSFVPGGLMGETETSKMDDTMSDTAAKDGALAFLFD